jgi:hypothetical protein
MVACAYTQSRRWAPGQHFRCCAAQRTFPHGFPLSCPLVRVLISRFSALSGAGLTVTCGIASNTALFSAAHRKQRKIRGLRKRCIRRARAGRDREDSRYPCGDLSPGFVRTPTQSRCRATDCSDASGEEEQCQRNEPISLRKSNEHARTASWSACDRAEDAPSLRPVARRVASVSRPDAAAAKRRARPVTCRPLLLLQPLARMHATAEPSAQRAGSRRSVNSRRCWRQAAPGRSARLDRGCR